MFFSIITPIHNVSRFIKQGAKSILSQSFKDFQWILVDDGSTDDSGDLCDELEKLDNRVVVLHQTNAGPGPARNLGIDNAQGDYLLFYDIDDLLRPDALLKMSSILQNHKPDMAVYSYSEICLYLNTKNDYCFPNLILGSNEEIREQYIEYLFGIKFNNGFVWNKAYKRDFINKNRLRFKPLRIQQDEVFNLDVYPHVESMVVSSEIIYDYYVYNKGNASSSYIATRPDVAIAVRNAFLALVYKWNITSTGLITYIHRRFVSQYLIVSLERDVLSSDLNIGTGQRIQYIKKLLGNSILQQSLDYLSSVGFKPKELYNKLYFRWAASKSTHKLYLLSKTKLGIYGIKGQLRRLLNQVIY